MNYPINKPYKMNIKSCFFVYTNYLSLIRWMASKKVDLKIENNCQKIVNHSLLFDLVQIYTKNNKYSCLCGIV